MSQVPIDARSLSVHSAGEPRRSARLLAGMRDAALSGGPGGTVPRPIIQDSWRRALDLGVDPDNGSQTGVLTADEIEVRRRRTPLGDVLPALRDGLVSVADEARHIMVVTDPEGRVLWRDGSLAVRRSADRLGFAEGASWSEEAVGTNAIGTALVTGRPMQVHSAEHFVRVHHQWTCAAAPLHDPRDGRLLGAVDVSGPAAAMHPTMLSLVTAVTRVAEAELRSRHWAAVDRLRSVAAPLLARMPGRAAVVDPNGWTAAVTGMPPVERITLPANPSAGRTWVPALGTCTLEPLPGGWLVRVGPPEEAPAAGHVVLDLGRPRTWTVSVSGAAGGWSQELSPRHAELLFVLALHRDGRSAAELAGDLFDDPSRTVTVRAEMSRLRRTLAGVLDHRPYRFADGVHVEVVRPAHPMDLLPHSTAPAVREARLRQ
ncbi:GAF domain-containing protein [Actinacidiphila sp. bgisy167]|uniref:helix-turn-helix domain-containing protein n=1 Tax=Actinacidiphila sp. bgisy167 TaxID=3413797 RepID=UPI003D7046B2